MKTRHIAEVIHNTLRAIHFSAGDYSVAPWADAQDAKRKQAVDWVNYYLQTPNASPTESHAAWVGAKLAEGWVLGPARDESVKTHPHLVSFTDLPAVNQAVGYAVCELVHTLTTLSTHYVNVAPTTAKVVAELAPVLEQGYEVPTAPADPSLATFISGPHETLTGPSESSDVTPLGAELDAVTAPVAADDEPAVAVGSEMEESVLSVNTAPTDQIQ